MAANTTSSQVYTATAPHITEENRTAYLAYLQSQTTVIMTPAIIFLSCLIAVGVVGNSLVLIVYSKKFKRTPTRIFIMAIAGFDLITNVIAIPGEIYDMFHIWDFNYPSLCRVRMYINTYTTITAAIILLAVAVVRYRKVCRPFGRQVSMREAKLTTFCIVVFSCIYSVMYGVINGSQTKPTPRPDVFGYECTTDDSYVDTIWPLVNTGLFLLLFISCTVPLVVLYCLIGAKAYQHRKVFGVRTAAAAHSATQSGHSQSSTSGPITRSTDDVSSSRDVDSSEDELEETNLSRCMKDNDKKGRATSTVTTHSLSEAQRTNKVSNSKNERVATEIIGNDVNSNSQNGGVKVADVTVNIFNPAARDKNCSQFEDINLTPGDNVTNSDKSKTNTAVYSKNILQQKCKSVITSLKKNCSLAKGQEVKDKGGKSRKLGKTTVMLIVISAVYIIGFMPHLVCMFFKFLAPDSYAEMDDVSSSFYNLFLRFYYLNSAANPVIYSFCDVNFRLHCLGIFRLCRPSGTFALNK